MSEWQWQVLGVALALTAVVLTVLISVLPVYDGQIAVWPRGNDMGRSEGKV